LVRGAYLVAGIVLVGIGYIGLVVPMMPGTIFFILALAAFQRSSPRMEAWLLNNRLIGPTLRDWRANGSIRLEIKILAIALLWLSVLGSCRENIRTGEKLWVVALLGVIAAWVTWYIASRPTKR
jgi:uncharacterized membrane protein YbaN (DUF454 family)